MSDPVEVIEGLRLRFPQRGPEFITGMETGVLALAMAQGERVIRRWIQHLTKFQIDALAPQLGYEVEVMQVFGDQVDIELTPKTEKPKRPTLRIVT